MRIYTLAIAFLIGTAAQAQVIRAEPFYTAPEEAAVAANLLLDSFPGAAVAYSLRKLDKDYNGSAIRVRRSSDNTEQDIGFVNNYLDTAGMKTFVGANNGFVVTWYNQGTGGSAKNMSQSTATQQPQIISNGAINYKRGDVAIAFDGSDDFMSCDSINHQRGFTFVTHSVDSIIVNLLGQSRFSTTDEGWFIMQGSDVGNNKSMRLLYGPTGAFTKIIQGSTNSLNKQNITTHSSSGTAWSGWVNNASQTITFVLGSGNTGEWFGDVTGANHKLQLAGLQRVNSVDVYSATQYHEVIIYEGDKSSDRAAITSNINLFYSIY